MRIQIPQASLPPDQLAAMLRQAFPRYEVTMRGGVPIVGNGLATGVMLKPDGPGALKTGWAFPSVAAQLLVTLTILAGLLPGLTLFLIVYLATKGGVARMEQEIATVLQGGPSPQLAAGMQPAGAGGPAPLPPTPFTLVVAGAAFLYTFSWLIGMVFLNRHIHAGSFGGLFWLLVGIGAVMVHFDEQRAHEAHAQGQSSASAGPGALIGGIGAILLSLSWTANLFMRPELDFWLVDTVVSLIAWIGAGVVLIASHAKRANSVGSTARKPGPLMLVFGIVNALSSLFSLVSMGMMLSSGYFNALVVVRSLLGLLASFAFAAGVLGRYFVHSNAPAGAAAPQQPAYGQPQWGGYPQQQAYPQQQYPQQGYPQQQYPQQQQQYPQQQYPQQGAWPPGYPPGYRGPGQGG